MILKWINNRRKELFEIIILFEEDDDKTKFKDICLFFQ
jgi:hypothetical protein